MKKLLLMAVIAAAFISCKKSETQGQETPDKKGGREVVLSSIVQNDSTIHTTTQKIWVNGVVIKTETTSFKTVNAPAVKDTVEDDNGDLKVIEHENKLPIFVTVQ